MSRRLLSSDIVVKAYFNQSDGFVGFEDNTPYSDFGFTEEQIEDIAGILKIDAPVGNTTSTIYQNAGWATTNYDSPDLDSTNNFEDHTIVEADAEENFESGTWTFAYKIKLFEPSAIPENIVYYTVTKTLTYKYGVTLPSAELTDVFTRENSILTVTDTSDYPITSIVTGTVSTTKTVNPTTVTKQIVIRPPYGSPLSTVTSTTSPATIGPNCYTGTYNLYLLAYAYYDVETTVRVVFKVEYETSVTLEDTTNIFNYYDTSINAINEQYLIYSSTNPRAADEYKINRDNIIALYALFLIYEGSSRDTTFIESKLEEILRLYGYSRVASTLPQEILPLGTGSVSEPPSGTTWHSGTETPPSPDTGDNGDYYLNTETSLVYKKELGAWINIMALGGSSTLRDSALIDSDYTITDEDECLFIDSRYNAVTLSLDSAANFTENKILTIKAKYLTYEIRINPYQSDKIEGISSYQFGTEGDSIQLRLYAGNWEIV